MAAAETPVFAGGGVRVVVTQEGEAGIATVHGEVDVYSAPRLREALDHLLAGGVAPIVVDLSDVSFVDSTGLGVLVGAHKRLELTGGRLRVVVPPVIHDLMQKTGLNYVFTLFDSRADALAAPGPTP